MSRALRRLALWVTAVLLTVGWVAAAGEPAAAATGDSYDRYDVAFTVAPTG